MKTLLLFCFLLLSLVKLSARDYEVDPDTKRKENQSKAYANDEAMSLEEEQQRGTLQRKIEEPRISNKWFRGNYLIYDCDKGFYACVNSESFEKCEYQRKSRKERRQTSLGCAPLKRFDTQGKCFEVQYSKVHNQVPKLFCIHPNFR